MTDKKRLKLIVIEKGALEKKRLNNAVWPGSADDGGSYHLDFMTLMSRGWSSPKIQPRLPFRACFFPFTLKLLTRFFLQYFILKNIS